MIDEVLIAKEVEKLLRDNNPDGSLSIKEIRNRVAKVLGDEVHKFKDEIKAIVKRFVLTQYLGLGQHDSLANLNEDEGKDDVHDDDDDYDEDFDDDDDDDDDDVDDDDDYDDDVDDLNVAAPWESNYGKLVWVKIYSSFPWWPSIVNDPNSLPIMLKKQATELIGKKLCISYLGDARFGFANLSQVRDFDEYYEDFSKQPSKKKDDDDKLQDAIKLALEYKENIQFVKNEPRLKKLKTETNSTKKLKSETNSTEKKVVKSPKDKPPKKSPNISSKNTSAQQESKLNKPKEIAKDAPANGHNNNSNSIIAPNKKKKVDNQVRKEEQVDIAEDESASEIEDDAEEDDEDYLSDKQSKRPAAKKVSDENDKSKKRKRDSSESIQEKKNNGEEVQSSTLAVLRPQRNGLRGLSRGGLRKQTLAPEDSSGSPSPSDSPVKFSVSNSPDTTATPATTASSASSDTPYSDTPSEVEGRPMRSCSLTLTAPKAKAMDATPVPVAASLKKTAMKKSPLPANSSSAPANHTILKYNSDLSDLSTTSSVASESATLYQQQLVLDQLQRSMEELVRRTEETERKHSAEITALTGVIDEYKKLLSTVLSNVNNSTPRDSYDIDSPPSSLLVANHHRGATTSSSSSSSSNDGEGQTENAFMEDVMRLFRQCVLRRENAELSKKLEELTFQMDMSRIFAKYNRK